MSVTPNMSDSPDISTKNYVWGTVVLIFIVVFAAGIIGFISLNGNDSSRPAAVSNNIEGSN